MRSARADDKVLAKVSQPCADRAEYQTLVLPGADGAASATSVRWAQQRSKTVTVKIDETPYDLVLSTHGTFAGEGDSGAMVTMWSATIGDAAAAKEAAARTATEADNYFSSRRSAGERFELADVFGVTEQRFAWW